MSEMMKLAEIVERLEGPCRETDAEIWPDRAEHRKSFDDGANGASAQMSWDDYVDQVCPRYTASLDAAMQLVPEGLKFEVTTTGYKPGATVCGDSLMGIHEGAYAATPALALCAASLRARAAVEAAHG